MKLIAINHRERKVYFKSPYNVDGIHNLDYKHSDLLSFTFIQDKQTISLIGELSYLEYFHQHSYKDIINGINIIKKLLPINIEVLKRLTMPTTLRFALESALYKFDNFIHYKQLHTNSLFELGTSEVEAFNSQVVKIKVARRSAEEELKLINQLFKKYPQHLFRLDANRQLNPQSILPYLDLDQSRIDYFEEPFLLPEDYEKLPIFPLAIDENAELLINDKLDLKNIKALIIKPTCHGLEKSIKLADLAKEKNIRAIFSSTFELDIGLNIIRSLAYKYSPNEYHGFETLRYLKYEI